MLKLSKENPRHNILKIVKTNGARKTCPGVLVECRPEL